MALTVQHELQARLEETDRLHRRAVEAARYEADLARRRYLQVDPANRLVADELEAQWNRALQQVVDAQETYDRHRHADRLAVDTETRERILALATDFPRLWHDPHTPDRERKRMVRLLIEDVTLVKTVDGLTAHIRYRGGATTTLTLARALNAWQLRETSTEIVALVDQLLDQHTDVTIATMLNATRLSLWHRTAVPQSHRQTYPPESPPPLSIYATPSPRHADLNEIADRLNVSVATVKIWAPSRFTARITAATTNTNASTSLPARMPQSKCKADDFRIDQCPTFSRIRRMRCSMKRSPSATAIAVP